MNRKQFEDAITASALNPYARAVLRAYASRNNYNDQSEESYPSQAWVAEWTGMHKDVVNRYVKSLVIDGWLVPASLHGRAQGYYLEAGKVNESRLMKAARQGNLDKQCPSGVDIDPDGQSPSGVDVSPSGVDINVLVESPSYRLHEELRTIEDTKEEPIEDTTTSASASVPDSSLPFGIGNGDEGYEKKKRALEFQRTLRERELSTVPSIEGDW